MPLEGQTATLLWGCLCACVLLALASQKPSKREFFVPTGTDLADKLLTIVLV
jgi:hypothetical protein